MAVDITSSLRRLDPSDPVKYDFALHRMGLWKKEEEVRELERLSGRALRIRSGTDRAVRR